MFKQEKLKPLTHKKSTNGVESAMKVNLALGSSKTELKKSAAGARKPAASKAPSEEALKPIKLQRSSTRSTKII